MSAPTADKTKRPARPSARAAVRKPARLDGRIKATLLLSEDLDFRLTTIAASLKLDRSSLAAQLIDAGLQRYGLDRALREFRGATPPASEDRQGVSAA